MRVKQCVGAARMRRVATWEERGVPGRAGIEVSAHAERQARVGAAPSVPRAHASTAVQVSFEPP
jgi:hypothetical protein